MFTIDTELAYQIVSPVCTLCQHLDATKVRACAAFPFTEGIPREIWAGENPHTQPYPGDSGVRFEAYQP